MLKLLEHPSFIARVSCFIPKSVIWVYSFEFYDAAAAPATAAVQQSEFLLHRSFAQHFDPFLCSSGNGIFPMNTRFSDKRTKQYKKHASDWITFNATITKNNIHAHWLDV